MSKKEYEEWFKSCDFIESRMTFYSFNNFLDNRIVIKKIYDLIDIRTKKLYKWYVYASFMTYKKKCLVWDYLNGSISDKDISKYLKK